MNELTAILVMFALMFAGALTSQYIESKARPTDVHITCVVISDYGTKVTYNVPLGDACFETFGRYK